MGGARDDLLPLAETLHVAGNGADIILHLGGGGRGTRREEGGGGEDCGLEEHWPISYCILYSLIECVCVCPLCVSTHFCVSM